MGGRNIEQTKGKINREKVVFEMEGGKEVNSEVKGGKCEYWEVRGKINGEEELHIGKEGGNGEE